jgi:antitoxin component YwqK of YwqJK toxin-antitoxin module
MVNKYLFISVFVFFAVGSACNNSNDKAISERLLKGEFDAYQDLDRVHCDSLVEDTIAGEIYFKDSLFSGVCFTYYPNTENELENRQIFKGKYHGHRIMFGPKGDTLMLNLYNHGKLLRESIGNNEVCLCDSLEVIEKDGKDYSYYFDQPYTGKCEKYYPGEDSSKLYIEENYLRGLSHGEMVVYGKDGDVILKEKYFEGVKVN